jgi:hypothetical protein
MRRAALLGVVALALLLVVLFAVLFFALPLYGFIWLYGEVVADETFLLLLAVMLLISPLDRRLGSTLSRRIYMPLPVKVLAALALVVGFLLFAFWAMVDLLGGYLGPGYTISTYPTISAIYHAIGSNHIVTFDTQGVMGFLSFSVAALGFVALRVHCGIGTAVRQGIAFFAAPMLVAFELALWNAAPLDMYWHVTTFASWSLGKYPAAVEFAGLSVPWAGNVYLLSNWFVLAAACGLLALGILTRRRVSHKPFHRKH